MKKILLILLLLIILIACQSQQLQPVDIEAGDMCSFCKMAISEKRYAAEFIDQDGTVFKFDDIGCMIRFIQERGLKDKIAVYFVTDYDNLKWLNAEPSSYVKSEAIPSPMASGLVAFKDRLKAEEFSRKYRGQILTFEDLWRR
ncbi:MAG TPA: nitrous oxide reductase accessory protein NosL [Candidatus Limnocylindrales bacterium]|nr:nitrous oxide reductase accessory protein NosL [Candidatus Limnocylindrales bacterium]